MTERTIEQINAEIAAIKKDSAAMSSTATLVIPNESAEKAYDHSFQLAGTVIGFGVFVLICITYLISKDKPIESLLRPFGTILIIIGALFLIVAGYSEKQIAPVIGLLGTVAGYILGRNSSGTPENKDERNGKSG